MGRKVLCGVVVLLWACAERPREGQRGEALERSARLLAKLDQLEADLHQQNAQLFVAGELEERHSSASQIACQVTDDHIQEIHRLALAQERKIQERTRKRNALAQARTKLTRVAAKSHVRPARMAAN
jgi:hypothetical protein